MIVRWMLIIAMALGAVTARATRKDEVTLLMVPRVESAVRLGLDLAARYPSLLISYRKLPSGKFSLHGWTGSQWVNVTEANYKTGTFFRTGPRSALLFESGKEPFPQGLLPSASWAPEVHRIQTVKTRPMLHLVGRYYDFVYEDWKWASRRYKLPIDAINPDGLNLSWYHKPLKEHLGSEEQGVEYNDLKFWKIVRKPAPPPEVQPEVETEIAAPASPPKPEAPKATESSISAENDAEPVLLDPFSGTVPAAEVYGAGSAEEVVGDGPADAAVVD